MSVKAIQPTRQNNGRVNVALSLIAIATLVTSSGCTTLLSPMEGIPVGSVPEQLLGKPKSDLIPVPLALLRRDRPHEYLLGEGDILGVYIEGVMPPKANEDQIASAPPVNFTQPGSDLPPSVGYPIPVRDDGTLPLPLVEPIDVEGKTLAEAEKLIRQAYVNDEKILRPGRDRILVSLMRERTHRVIVIREDSAGQEAAFNGVGRSADEVISGTSRSGTGHTLDMPAYKNDVMHALAQTGGLPGLNAKNAIKIIKASRIPSQHREEIMMQLFSQQSHISSDCNCGCGIIANHEMVEDPFTTTIPLRVRTGQMPNIDPSNVILEDGDIVYIESRDTEVFYTAGLLPGGQFPIPRDYDLDVLEAMSIAGTGVGSSSQSTSGGGVASSVIGGGFGGATPTQLFVVRKSPCGQSVNILIDLKTAVNDPRQRILIQPGDTLVLRYKPCEEVVNFGLVAFFTFGVRQLLR